MGKEKRRKGKDAERTFLSRRKVPTTVCSGYLWPTKLKDKHRRDRVLFYLRWAWKSRTWEKGAAFIAAVDGVWLGRAKCWIILWLFPIWIWWTRSDPLLLCLCFPRGPLKFYWLNLELCPRARFCHPTPCAYFVREVCQSEAGAICQRKAARGHKGSGHSCLCPPPSW